MTKAKCGASNPATQGSTPKMNMGGMAMKTKPMNEKPAYGMGGMATKKPKYGMGGMAMKKSKY